MTDIVHIANTQVEMEFAPSSSSSPHQPDSLEKNFEKHPLFLQLQYLPLLYADPSDVVAVTEIPDQKYLLTLQETMKRGKNENPTIIPLSDRSSFQGMSCRSWGASRLVKEWAEERNVHYSIPDWEIAQLVNSKAFSFRYTHLTHATLISNKEELITWLKDAPRDKVFKTCFGLAGKGNFCFNDTYPSSQLLTFCQREWEQKRPILAEPWCERLEDFSTQWLIHPDQKIEFIGGTRFETDEKGRYQGTLAGPQEQLFASLESFLEEHCQIVQKALSDIAALGFFGNLGIDAFIYRHPETKLPCLNPLVEINGRETMSLVALRLQQRLWPKEIVRLSFQHRDDNYPSLLPEQLKDKKGKLIPFRRKLYYSK